MALKFEYKDSADKNKEDQKEKSEDIVFYETNSDVRYICFILADGKQKTFYYSDLFVIEFDPENNTIMLTFSSYLVMLEGFNLETLSNNTKAHMVKTIKCANQRYSVINESSESTVTKIEISERN